jgi:hypothetical protein
MSSGDAGAQSKLTARFRYDMMPILQANSRFVLVIIQKHASHTKRTFSLTGFALSRFWPNLRRNTVQKAVIASEVSNQPAFRK